MRVAFFGLPLAALLLAQDGHELTMAVLSPVEAPGRRRLRYMLAADRVVDALDRQQDLERRVNALLHSHRPDLLVSWYWTRLLPATWLEFPPLGALGVHPSLLPRHRGPNPFFGAIDAGDRWSGISVHRLTREYDSGDVLLSKRVLIGDRNAWQLARALDRPSLQGLRAVVMCLRRGEEPTAQPQDAGAATWAPEPTGAMLKVDWNWPTERILRRIRALSPVPGLALEVRGVSFLATRAEAVGEYPRALVPGEASALGEPPKVLAIRTGDGAIGVSRAVITPESDPDQGEEIDAAELALLVACGRGGC